MTRVTIKCEITMDLPSELRQRISSGEHDAFGELEVLLGSLIGRAIVRIDRVDDVKEDGS